MINKTFPITEKLLSNGFQLTQNLLQQLQAETELLNQSQAAASLEIVIRQKQQIVGELNTFSKQLGQILETEKLPNNRSGINAYFDKADKAGLNISPAVEKWEQIIEWTAKNKELNEQNGASINLLLRHTRQSLNILKGKPQTSHTYGPDGAAKSELYSSTLISA